MTAHATTSDDAPALDPRRPDAPSPSVLEVALRRFWWVAVTLGVVCAIAGAVAGTAVEETYVAHADLNVGQVTLPTQSLPSFAQGAKTLATSYSRIATSEAVVNPVARAVGISSAEVRDRLSASPLPDTTLFRIEGTGTSAVDAQRFTQVAVREAQRAIRAFDPTEQGVRDALEEFRRSSRTAALRREELDDLRVRRQRDRSSVSRDRIVAARVRVDAAELAASAAGSAYQSLRSQDPRNDKGARVLNSAISADSDRSRNVQRFAFGGLCLGLLLGFALALTIAARRLRRA